MLSEVHVNSNRYLLIAMMCLRSIPLDDCGYIWGQSSTRNRLTASRWTSYVNGLMERDGIRDVSEVDRRMSALTWRRTYRNRVDIQYMTNSCTTMVLIIISNLMVWAAPINYCHEHVLVCLMNCANALIWWEEKGACWSTHLWLHVHVHEWHT